jgi:hypothetical protein
LSKAVKVIGNIGIGSGYRQAATNIFECFEASKVNCNFFHKDGSKANYKSSGLPSDVAFHITAPPFNMSSEKYNIGYFYWETESFPSQWVKDINRLDEVWCPCYLMVKCLNKINYKGKVRVVPTPSRDKRFVKNLINFKIEDKMVVDDSCFKFYSIFQWNHRKGFDLLIKGYLEEFSEDENVLLILKTNPILSGRHEFLSFIKKYINKVKKSIKKRRFPKILVLDYFLTNKEIDSLHEMADCFVLPHRGEGWGMPIARAIQYDNYLITTKFGGVSELLDNDSAHIINHVMEPVHGMVWSGLYESSQQWARPSIRSLKENMRVIYDDRDFSTNLNREPIKVKLSKEHFIKNIEAYL